MVSAQHVWKSYGATDVLRDVSLDVSRGSVVSIMGPSGSGKSTFLRCLNHLETLDGGRILIDGEYVGYQESGGVLRELKPSAVARRRSSIGMVFQAFNVFPHMTALENVIEAPVGVLKMPKSEAREMGMALLQRVGLANKASAYPSQLSGGQKQRVAIARALGMEPKLMLFDEPTSALDPELVGEVLNVIRDLAATGMTMIIVTHELNFARQSSSVAVFMDQGRIVESGPPQQVLYEPVSERARAFLRHVT